MSLITQVGAALSAALTNFNLVAKAWTTEPVEEFGYDTPACLYYLAGIQSDPSPYDSQDYQPGDRTIGVLIVCEADNFEDRWAEVNAALAGFQPTGGTYESVEHVNGDLLGIHGDLIWWRDIYAVRCYRGEI